jgi:cyclic beta-1,2-glucan synthetase
MVGGPLPDPLAGDPSKQNHHARICPALTEDATWDDTESLRGDIQTPERLSEHAAEVARAQGLPWTSTRPSPLPRRFLEARRMIDHAYDVLERNLGRSRPPSPAEEWLLDNAYVVEDQIREIKEDLPRSYLVELPRLALGRMRGYPRVYGVCLDHLRHTDGRVDLGVLTSYVLAYQTVRPLTIGELWAIPIMLRLGLVLAVGALAGSEATGRERERGDVWAARVIANGRTPAQVLATLSQLEKSDPPVTPPLVVELLRNLREHDAPLGAASQWVRAKCEGMHSTPEELTRQQHLQLAADQVAVGNAITSMRAISALDWNAFFESTSVVERVLRHDPASVYSLMGEATRDRYRHAVERMARRSPSDERNVAEAAITLAMGASAQQEDPARTHVGYWIVGDGSARLERQVGYRPTAGEWCARRLLAHASAWYLGTILVITVTLCALTGFLGRDLLEPWVLASLVLLLVIPVSEMVVAVVNSVVMALVPPRILPKMALENGIPSSDRTLVVIPALLEHSGTVAELLEGLEIRSLANLDANLHFALLTDHCDADAEHRDGEDALVALARAGIARLNAKWEGPGEHRYALLHRRRVWDVSHRRWMGWERKRGKLAELNQLLRGRADTTFTVVTAPPELLVGVRYVITLDADTELPRDVARQLVATLAHPLNRPRVDPVLRRVVRGHALVQPRVGIVPRSSRRTRYSRIAAGVVGIDPYTTAVSDVYQDLFDEGSYVGKAIYDVDAFSTVLEGRVAPDCMLSHDLFEGIFAHSALASDIEVLDAEPTSYEVAARRRHRWLRGDWQMLPWLLERAKLSTLRAIDAWKIVDNLRRSLLAPAMVAACLVGWFLHPLVAGWVTGTLAVVLLVPVLTRTVLKAVRTSGHQALSSTLGGELFGNARQSLLRAVFLLDDSVVSLDAIVRTLHRLGISHRNMLEWTTMGQAERGRAARVHPRIVLGATVAAGVLAALAWRSPLSLPFAAPVLLLWIAAPAVAAWLSRPAKRVRATLAPAERKQLRLVARRTWRYFETFVTADDHHLPPDNYQEDPRPALARRTSPTNIGLYLLSVVAAHDFGFIDVREVLARLGKTFDTMDRLEHRDGHLLNWFDTSTLGQLEPKYVSTVDSGNLAAYLWTLREACDELLSAPLWRAATLDAADDALALAASVPHAEIEPLRALLAEARDEVVTGGDGGVRAMCRVCSAAESLRVSSKASTLTPECMGWVTRAASVLGDAAASARALAPFLELSAGMTSSVRAAMGDGWNDVAALISSTSSPRLILARADELIAACARVQCRSDAAAAFLTLLGRSVQDARDACAALAVALSEVGVRAGAMADAMNFRFLYDERRKLFSIGYNVGSARLDSSHYDLLASEARLASFVAIAKGDAPHEHWFRLGRQRAATGASERALLSWSGSMFEYLMPLLVMKTPEDTLLHETYGSVVDAQVAYGVKQAVPWGVSESAYNLMDLAMTYQYRAFGVPGLGFKAGLGDDCVIAPYATVLALLVRPRQAAENLRALTHLGLLGKYGFYDAVDFTPGRCPPGRTNVVVKTFMAHHQGMTLLAIDDALHDGPMQKRFHRDPRVKASELLLEERIPQRVPLVEIAPVTHRKTVANDPDLDVVEHVGLATRGVPRLHLLGHGDLSTAVTVLGEGFTTWKDLDVSRFREDQAIEAGGIYLYVRDHTAGATWSAGFQPTKVEPTFYDVALAIDRVEIRRQDGDIETTTEIAVSPDRPAEVRRVTLTNHGPAVHELDITSYTEVVLAPRAADVAHRAFGGMFVETEALPEHRALLARRRNQSVEAAETWLVQVLCTEGDAWQPGFEHETARASFIGRGRTTTDPAALHRPLSGAAGTVLDPVLALRRAVRLEPGGRARVTLATGLATTRDEGRELAARYSMPDTIQRAFELAWADARVELKHIGITVARSHRLQRLLSAVVFPQPELRAAPDGAALHGHGRSAMWALGLASELPMLVVHIDDPEFSELLRDVLLAQELWRSNGVTVDVVVLNDEAPGYMQPLHEALMSLVRASPAAARLDRRGGVFIRHTHELTGEQVALVSSEARVSLVASRGSLARQLGRATGHQVSPTSLLTPSREPRPPRRALGPVLPELTFANGTGGFGPQGSEYVMLLNERTMTPLPWCNVMSNARFGALVSESGASFTWNGNSQRHRLTPWSNDPVCDPSGETFWMRDDDDGSSWSLTPEPAGVGADYVVRHAPGYSTFEHHRGGLSLSLSVCVSPDDPVKVWRLSVRNDGKTARRLSLLGVVEWVLGASRERSRISIATDWDVGDSVLLATNPLSLYPERCALFTATRAIGSVSGDRNEVYGAAGSRGRPAALARSVLSGRVGAGLDPCGALLVPLVIEPGQSAHCAFLLGEGESVGAARALARTYRESDVAERTLERAKKTWRRILDAVVVHTPDPALDVLVNHWLPYQVLSCRVWGRSAFYQSGGAYGFRDQIQDVLGLLHTRPDIAREHLLRAAAHQFVEGDVQHWWHDGTGEGVRTRCSDDMLWLPYAVSHYVRTTGDVSVLGQAVPFLLERALQPNEDDLFATPQIAPQSASLYEHCTRALDVGATAGCHGLPKMGGGDWNDGMNRVGRKGEGESVWLAWFLAHTAQQFAAVARARGDDTRGTWCDALVRRQTDAVDEHAWDGAWYRRAFFDDGTALGSRENTECSIDAIAQSWAVIAGIGDPGRAERAVASSEQQLIRTADGLMRLLWPPFDHAEPDPGYIRAYPNGIRENGGQYTHGVLWTVHALTLMGQGDRAVALLSLLDPVRHATTPELVQRYQVEPYVVAADVYDAPGHVGRGGWTWYTGAASWRYRIVLEQILGVRRVGQHLLVDPCIAGHWKRFELTYRDGEGEVHIVVENPDGIQRGVRHVEIDGRRSPDGTISLTEAPGRREVRVIMGQASA